MDIRRGLRISVYDLGRGGAGASRSEREPAETDLWVLAQAVETAGHRAGRPVEV